MDKHIFWLASYPKSGNTLLRAIITCLFFSKDGIFNFELLKHTSQFEKRNRLDIIKNINKEDYLSIDNLRVLSKYWKILQTRTNLKIPKGFGFIKTHSCLVSMFNNWFTSENITLGTIYMIRDPRDVAISWSNHTGLNIEESINFMLNYKSCIEWARTESNLPKNILPKTYLGSWSDHVLSWTENNLKVPKLIIKYEDLVYNKETIINEIINFFELNFSFNFENIDFKISNILKSTNFNKLQKLEKENGFNEAGSDTFFRKGEKNQWKNTLNIKQINKIENKFRDFMNKFGYE